MNGFKMDGARPLPDCTYEMENVIPTEIRQSDFYSNCNDSCARKCYAA